MEERFKKLEKIENVVTGRPLMLPPMQIIAKKIVEITCLNARIAQLEKENAALKEQMKQLDSDNYHNASNLEIAESLIDINAIDSANRDKKAK